MPDWAIVLVAAFGGGLAGAVLQPVASHLLERIRSKEEIRKRRERHLRRMLTAGMKQGRKAISVSNLLQSRQARGAAVDPDEIRERLRLEEGMPLWEPERIADSNLRNMACEYMEMEAKLAGLVLYGPFNGPTATALTEHLEDLQGEISLRMDELNWPEVDD